jgi:ribonuclease III
MSENGTPTIEEVRTKKKLEALQLRIGYRFDANIHLLRKAVEHSSSWNGKGNELSSETLEFLGDAVLYLVITKRLFNDCNWQDEGVLTELRKSLIKNSTLARVGDRLGLREDELLLVGKSVQAGNGVTDKMVADAVEAIIGAIYWSDDKRLESVDAFVNKWFFQSGIKDEVENDIDWISRLKVWCDKHGIEWPIEPPCQKQDGIWSCRLMISGFEELGEGSNKSIAKRQAARKILQKIESRVPS